jgi:hypothetical protein
MLVAFFVLTSEDLFNPRFDADGLIHAVQAATAHFLDAD